MQSKLQKIIESLFLEFVICKVKASFVYGQAEKLQRRPHHPWFTSHHQRTEVGGVFVN